MPRQPYRRDGLVDMDDDLRWGLRGFGPSTYGEAFADVYDDWYSDLGDTDMVAALARHLPARSARVLELGAGTGRLLAAVAEARAEMGDDLVGIDSSPAMLAIAEERLGSLATLVEGDFSIELPSGGFDAVFAGWNTLFNLPDDEALASCLALVADVLVDDGFFLVDAVVPRGASADHVGVKSMSAEKVVLSVSRLDADNRRILGQFIELADGRPPRLRPWSLRWWTPEHLEPIAHRAGLVIAEAWSDGSGTPFDEESERMVLLMRHMAPPETGRRVVS